ncbi:MAG: carbohydrate ABC transporter permease [Negativicutes bacterium]|nr:carbohydrate ABC transporter permease [Negativicutes bacterium]
MTEYTPPKVLINAENFRKVIFQLLLVAISIADLFPIYYVIVTSFKTHPEYLHNLFGPPISPTFDNFQQALIQGNLLLWFRNSVIMTVTTVTIVTLICSAAAFATSKMEFKGRKALLRILVSLMIMPPVVMIIPLFLLMVRVGLINNFLGVIIIYSGLLAPFSVYLLNSFFGTIQDEILAAASIDGCSTFQIFRYIVLPLSGPAITTQVVVNGLWVWNELMISLIFLQGNDIRTLMPGLTQFQGRFTINQPLIMAGALLGMLPVMLLYLVGQKYFVRGLTAGAVK